MAAARHTEIFAHRLARDVAPGVENALDHGGVDLRRVTVQELRADHHRHAGEANIVLERATPTGKLAARFAFARRLDAPGAVRILPRRRKMNPAPRLFHRR